MASREPQRPVRTNGWQLPPHPLQCFLWLSFLLAGVSGFFFLIPVLPDPWQTVSFACLGFLYVTNLICHVLVVSVDPSCSEAEYSFLNPLKVWWDRQARRFRMERLERPVGKTYYCQSCNKDVKAHDHHCFWLNNCVGARNFRFFFNCVLTGFLIVVQLSAMFSYIILADFVLPQQRGVGTFSRIVPMLVNAGSSSVLLTFPLETAAWVVLIVATATLIASLVATLFIGCFLGCHVHLFCAGKSSSEIISGWMRRRNAPEN